MKKIFFFYVLSFLVCLFLITSAIKYKKSMPIYMQLAKKIGTNFLLLVMSVQAVVLGEKLHRLWTKFVNRSRL